MAVYVGQQLGNYRLRQLLGQGGSADVYLGEHIHLGTLAAIKVLHILIGKQDLDDFRREARFIAHLLHPHIVRVLDFGVEGNVPFLVMDYATNGTLRQSYPKGTILPLPTIVSYATQTAQALQYAHDRKVVHRDVKPENLLLDINRQVLLSDFGISALEKNTNTIITQNRISSTAAGTVFYMAPEQFQGNPHPSSDQYSLGVVVYEWLCGSSPFSGEALAVIYQHMHVLPPPLREKISAISPTIEQVVLKALAKDPKQRFVTVSEFAQALERASQAQDASSFLVTPQPAQKILNPPPVRQSNQAPEPKTLVIPPQRTNKLKIIVEPKHSRIHQRKALSIPKGMVVLLITFALMLVAGSVAFLLATSNKSSNAAHPVNTSATATATITAAINAYNAATIRGVMAGFDPQHSRVNPYEKMLSPANVSKLVRDWKTATAGSIGSSATIANGIVYISSSDGYLYAFNLKMGGLLWKDKIGSTDFGCAPTIANGIVYMGAPDKQLYALDARTGKTIWTAPTGGSIGSSPTLFNGVIYIGSDDHKLYAFNAGTGAFLWSYPTGDAIRSSPAVANGIVYVGSDDGNLYAFSVSTHQKLWSFPTRGKVRSSPAIANGIVYIGSDDNNLYAINTLTGNKVWSFPTRGLVRSSPAVFNGVVYVGSDDNNLYAIDATKGTPLWTASTGGAISSSPTIANGVLYIGSSDHQLYAFNASGCGKSLCTPLWTAPTGDQVNSSPTVANGVVYVGSNDGNLYAFHLAGTNQ